MKKKLVIVLMLALVVTLIPVSAVFAGEPWDVEDPCVASNEDFSRGKGWDGAIKESHKGGQHKKPQKADGFNLYRDDASGTGNLDSVEIKTLTPDKIDLPNVSGGGKWKRMSGEASNTWYWAMKPRGYNLPPLVVSVNEPYNRYKGLSGVFWVEVLNFSGFDTYKWDNWGSFDRVLAEPVVAFNRANGLIRTLYIPEGTHLSYPGRPYTLVTNLFIEKDDSGGVFFEPGNMDFSQPCSLKLAHSDGIEEVVTFTEIRDGLPVPISEVAPASSKASSTWIYGT